MILVTVVIGLNDVYQILVNIIEVRKMDRWICHELVRTPARATIPGCSLGVCTSGLYIFMQAR